MNCLSDLLNHPVEVLRSPQRKLSPGTSEYLSSPVLSTVAQRVTQSLTSFSVTSLTESTPSKSCLPPTPTSAPLRGVSWWLEMEDSKNMTSNSHRPRNSLYPQRSGKYSNCHLYVAGNVIKNMKIFSKGIQNYYSLNKYLSGHHV